MAGRGALRWLLLGAAAPVVLALSAAACSPGSSAAVPDGTGGSGGLGLLVDGGDGGDDPDAACALFEEQAVIKPVNLYVMFDKSSSMAADKWEAAETGLGAFVDDPASAGLRVALRFFPRAPDATPACDQHAYMKPLVDFGPLPDNADPLKQAIANESPDGFGTPMYPALGGALLAGIEVAANHPDEVSAVLLVTDGEPEGPAPSCGGVDPEDPAEIAALAEAGANHEPPVATYVVGLPGVDQSTANLVAAAGGTTAAILVGTTNVAQQFQQALAKVRGEALPCSYEVPAAVRSGQVAIGKVNVEVTPSEGEPAVVPQNQGCNGDGWKYDDPAAPSAIVLCPSTCATLKADLGAKIRVLLGCATVVK